MSSEAANKGSNLIGMFQHHGQRSGRLLSFFFKFKMQLTDPPVKARFILFKACRVISALFLYFSPRSMLFTSRMQDALVLPNKQKIQKQRGN